MFVAWWTGRGYLTIWIVIASAILFEFARAALNMADGVWIFGLSMLAASVANWLIGRKFNKKSLAKVRSHRLKERLLYRARNKFMSVPMETFSLIIAAAGVAALVSMYFR